ncbi:uncharacterized protein LOC134624385 [Pelmatolapia mariae]|uniref:uncharacterized protein LOC134624157 n=1 Tax=Pelmatolapia mariae TaxID=158779 RepID=UPI002FE606CF
MKMMMLVLLLLISQHASGLEVYEGVESVLLHCQVSVDVSDNDTAAVWDREELSDATVHLRLQKSDDLSVQNKLYKHRTSMRVDALQTGDLSLTLRKPTVSDSGTYTCIYRKAGEDQSKTVVQLKVTEPPPVWPKVLAAVLITLIILAAAFGLFMCCAYKRMKDREALQPEMVEVPQGEESVLLPFRTTADPPQNVTVEWTDSNYMKVHVYESGNNQPDKQHQVYSGRTEMDEDPLRTKDLSLTLKDLRPTDSGVYTCTVYDKDRNMLLQKSVTLSVRVPPPEVVNVTDAEESVLLPFKTTADLPRDVTVEWTLTEPTERKVHVYKSGNNQSHNQDQDYRGRTEMNENPLRTKDLSLTLKYPRLTDSGVYTCTVYNKDGYMLLQKVVTLRFRESVPDIVQVQNGNESVLLPFKTPANLPQDITVEWTFTETQQMKVHVYKSGNNPPDKQHQCYSSCTVMSKGPVTTKDLSLTLKDLHLTNGGLYTCNIYKDGHMLLRKSVTLNVYDTVSRMGTVYGNKSYLLQFEKTDQLDQISKVKWEHIYPKYKFIKEIEKHQGNEKDLSLNLEDLRLTDSGIYTCTAYRENGDILLQQSVIFSVRDFQLEKVEVTEGEESVLLPFKTTADLHHVDRVQWFVSEPKLMMVHCFGVYNYNQTGKQDPAYRGRTEMNKDSLRTGDLSLTLKKPLPTDSGSYTCTVGNKDGRILVQKVVTLRVRATLKGTMADMFSRLRRRSAPNAEVKEDVRNRSHEDFPLMDVHSA